MMEQRSGYREILKQKEYMKTVIAAVINRFGDSIDSIAFAWLVYQLTQSAAWSAIIFGVNRVPTVLLQPFAGAAVEGMNKKRIMVVTDIIRGICVGLVATAYMTGSLNQWMLLAATIIISSAEAFRNPASSALLPKLLDKELYSFGISFNTSVSSIMELIGLGLAGVIISAFSLTVAIYIDMVTFFLSALVILSLKVKEEHLSKAKVSPQEFFLSLKGGVQYLKGNSFLKYMIVIAVFLNAILVPLNSLQAPLVSEVLHSNEMMLSVLSLGITFGMIIGAISYPYVSTLISKKAILYICGYTIAGYYLSLVAVGEWILSAAWKYIIIALVSFLLGCAIAIANTFAGVEFMKAIEESYIARVSSIMNASNVAAMPLVSFLLSGITGFASTGGIFLTLGLLDILVCIVLLNGRRLAIMEVEQKVRAEVSEGEIEDSKECESGR